MTEKINPVLLDDIVASSAHGVLRALEARQAGAEKLSTADLLRSGFGIHFHIIAGGIFGPQIEQLRVGGPSGPALPGGGSTPR